LYMRNKAGKRTLVDLSHKERGFRYLDDDAAEQPEWVEQALRNQGAGALRLIHRQDGVPTVSFVRSILNPQNYNDVIGFLVVSNLKVLLARDLVSIELPERADISLFN